MLAGLPAAVAVSQTLVSKPERQRRTIASSVPINGPLGISLEHQSVPFDTVY
jgi:hypothetical protein